MISVLVFGAAGRMGTAVRVALERDERIARVYACLSARRHSTQIEGGGHRKTRVLHDGARELEAVWGEVEVAIDVTTPQSALAHAEAARAHGVAFVCGTTGFSPEAFAELQATASRNAVLYAANFSLGIALLSSLVERAAASLPASRFDAEVLEMHHRHKKDAPSGTAVQLGERICAGGGRSKPSKELGRGVRKEGEVGYGVLRGGGVIGEHHVLFAGDKERLTLSHEAFSREIFAEGTVEAALWMKGRAAGLYSMANVLGIKDR